MIASIQQDKALSAAINAYLHAPTLDNKAHLEKMLIRYDVLAGFTLSTTNHGKKGVIQLKQGVSINDSLINSIHQLVIAAQQKMTIAELTAGNVARFF
ncbi:hypothetical protein [uncultured Leuconostoc sp.]|uniref:hypothetical protein n=1 Tax=uncultured Leuconostoc sp. TaxID=173262 RepID=UPI002805A8B1|nr:hypothetical protein [uncultured Leuconostoc sp.]